MSIARQSFSEVTSRSGSGRMRRHPITKAWEIVAAKTPRTTNQFKGSYGVFVENTRTNYFLNSESPATQTISLNSGTYTCWIEGSGTVSLSGSASGIAKEDEPVSFTLTASGSVTFTVVGTVTVCQVENGPYATSLIRTSDAAVTVNNETIDITLSREAVEASKEEFSIAGFIRIPWELGDLSFTHGVLGVGGTATRNAIRMLASSSGWRWEIYGNGTEGLLHGLTITNQDLIRPNRITFFEIRAKKGTRGDVLIENENAGIFAETMNLPSQLNTGTIAYGHLGDGRALDGEIWFL